MYLSIMYKNVHISFNIDYCLMIFCFVYVVTFCSFHIYSSRIQRDNIIVFVRMHYFLIILHSLRNVTHALLLDTRLIIYRKHDGKVIKKTFEVEGKLKYWKFSISNARIKCKNSIAM